MAGTAPQSQERLVLLSQQISHDSEPFRIERLSADGFDCATVPILRVALIAFFAVEVSMYPRTLDAFILLSGFVRSSPIALCIPPQSGERVREFGWWLVRGERLAEIVEGH